MSKSIAVLLAVSLAIGSSGCGAWSQPGRETKYERARREQEEIQQEQHDNGNGAAIVAVSIAILAAPFVYVGQQIELARGNTPAKAAREMNDPAASPDTHRQGIIDLVTKWDFTKRPPYTTRYKQIAEHDPNDTVRAMAIRALNISRDATATPIFIAALEDDSPLIRLEACKALANIPDDNAIPGLLRRVAGTRQVMLEGNPESIDEDKDVRIAAADALHRYRTLEVARTLVNQLGDRDFGVAWQANRSLIALTGQDFDYDQVEWLQYLTGPEKPFG